MLCQSFPCPSPRFPSLLSCCDTVCYCFYLKKLRKNPPYVLRIRLKSLLLHPLSETERRSVDMMAGFSVPRSRVFFRSFFRTLSGPRKKKSRKSLEDMRKSPYLCSRFPFPPWRGFPGEAEIIEMLVNEGRYSTRGTLPFRPTAVSEGA